MVLTFFYQKVLISFSLLYKNKLNYFHCASVITRNENIVSSEESIKNKLRKYLLTTTHHQRIARHTSGTRVMIHLPPAHGSWHTYL